MTFIESETIELKSSVVADLCKEVIAFANTRGGTLYIGVEDNGTVIGVDSADRVTLQINNMVRDSIKPDITMFVHYETQVIDDKQIIAVTVQEGTDRPYYLGSKGLKPSGVYVRNGTSTDPASDTAIRKMFLYHSIPSAKVTDICHSNIRHHPFSIGRNFCDLMCSLLRVKLFCNVLICRTVINPQICSGLQRCRQL